MSSVPSEYRALITTLETLKEDQLKWNYVRDRMITEYGRIKGSTNDVDDTSKHDHVDDALYMGDRQKDFKKCYYCDKKGHVIKECSMKQADIERRRQNEEERAAFCNDERSMSTNVAKVEDDFSPEIALQVSINGAMMSLGGWSRVVHII